MILLSLFSFTSTGIYAAWDCIDVISNWKLTMCDFAFYFNSTVFVGLKVTSKESFSPQAASTGYVLGTFTFESTPHQKTLAVFRQDKSKAQSYACLSTALAKLRYNDAWTQMPCFQALAGVIMWVWLWRLTNPLLHHWRVSWVLNVLEAFFS